MKLTTQEFADLIKGRADDISSQLRRNDFTAETTERGKAALLLMKDAEAKVREAMRLVEWDGPSYG